MLNFRSCAIGMCLFLSSTLGFAYGSFSRVDDLFQHFKSMPVDLKNIGSICEEIAYLELESIYPPNKYEISGGVVYRVSGQTRGELDVVVLDKENDNEVVAVGEVKCWRKPKKGLTKARQQLDRFQRYMALESPIQFKHLRPESYHFRVDQFDENPEYFTVGQKGTVADGYTHEISLGLDVARELSRRISACQQAGRCPTPFGPDFTIAFH